MLTTVNRRGLQLGLQCSLPFRMVRRQIMIGQVISGMPFSLIKKHAPSLGKAASIRQWPSEPREPRTNEHVLPPSLSSSSSRLHNTRKERARPTMARWRAALAVLAAVMLCGTNCACCSSFLSLFLSNAWSFLIALCSKQRERQQSVRVCGRLRLDSLKE